MAARKTLLAIGRPAAAKSRTADSGLGRITSDARPPTRTARPSPRRGSSRRRTSTVLAIVHRVPRAGWSQVLGNSSPPTENDCASRIERTPWPLSPERLLLGLSVSFRAPQLRRGLRSFNNWHYLQMPPKDVSCRREGPLCPSGTVCWSFDLTTGPSCENRGRLIRCDYTCPSSCSRAGLTSRVTSSASLRPRASRRPSASTNAW